MQLMMIEDSRIGYIGNRELGERKRMEDALAESERMYRELADNLPDPVIRYDAEGRCTYANPAWEKITGIPARDVIGRMAAEISMLVDPVGYQRQLLATARAGGGDIEVGWKTRDLGTRIFQLRIVPETGRDGRLHGSLAIGRDITESKEAEIRLRHSHDILRALAAQYDIRNEEERRDIARKIHEDLAQNLSALRMGLVVLDNHPNEERRADTLATLYLAIDRSMRLIRDMVTALRPTVLDHGIGAALRWLAGDVHKGLGIEYELAIDDAIALDDETATFLFRAAQELLINAALHAAARSVSLSLAIAGDACVLTVRDDGHGFDPAAPRGDDAFGLLRLAEQAARHDGELFIDAAPGRGTGVEIRIPAPSCRD